MASCALELQVDVAFVHDGVFVLKREQGQLPSGDPLCNLKQVYKSFLALSDFGVDRIFLYANSVQSRGLTLADYPTDVEICDRELLADQIKAHDYVLVF